MERTRMKRTLPAREVAFLGSGFSKGLPKYSQAFRSLRNCFCGLVDGKVHHCQANFGVRQHQPINLVVIPKVPSDRIGGPHTVNNSLHQTIPFHHHLSPLANRLSTLKDRCWLLLRCGGQADRSLTRESLLDSFFHSRYKRANTRVKAPLST